MRRWCLLLPFGPFNANVILPGVVFQVFCMFLQVDLLASEPKDLLLELFDILIVTCALIFQVGNPLPYSANDATNLLAVGGQLFLDRMDILTQRGEESLQKGTGHSGLLFAVIRCMLGNRLRTALPSHSPCRFGEHVPQVAISLTPEHGQVLGSEAIS
ncbi:hypothetical protein NDU88_006193 [Pleurodeles waltl]|uniref:Uncharacterized protein n=1 Tax=Pleurodeles waltl TaxID=8319 RepID=A0AAV7N6J0_PLEWA|nr:hypothetical protein NDU88_006193 [Pleurodeles waltl]